MMKKITISQILNKSSKFVEKIHHKCFKTLLKMKKTDIITRSKSDLYYLKLIGNYVKNNRLQQNKTQAQLALEAGINRTTLVQLEKGGAINLLSLIQVLRSLNKLNIFNDLEEKPQLSPLKLAALEQKKRSRASSPKKITPKFITKRKSDW